MTSTRPQVFAGYDGGGPDAEGRGSNPFRSQTVARRVEGHGFLSDPAGSLAGMSGTEQAAGAGRVVAQYWAAAEARDWDAFGALLAQDVVYEVPQTREQVSGRDAYVRFNAEGFPGDWHLAVQRIVSQDRAAVSMIEFSEAGASQTGLCFFDLDETGRIVRIADFWPDPYEPPAGRAHLAGRY
jgi:ketosteroid isomerase-like protein